MELAARLNRGETLADRILKVDHAGEHGAVQIYRGQLLVSQLFWPKLRVELREFLEHERNHRRLFADQLSQRSIRRCRSFGLCGLGGFVLGLLTGLCGPSAIAATTVAVERVVLRHLAAQLAYLRDSDPDAYSTVVAIHADEQHHHDRAAFEMRQGRFWPRVLNPIVSASTETVIWLGMHL